MKTNRKHNVSGSKTSLIVLGGLLGITTLSGAVLKSTVVKADVDDEITITVSASCTMSGSVTDAHTGTITNGQYDSTIGETSINIACNDNAGFAVYAIGYTGNSLGNNVLTSTTLGSTHDIATGTQTSGQDSGWAMKLGPDTAQSPSYPLIIAGSSADEAKTQGDPDFTSFQEVPNDYTKVAYRTTNTDAGTNAEGSTFTTTYQVYISPTQTAGAYQGKVKYVLVHPNSAPAPELPQGLCTSADTCMQQQTTSSLAQKLPATGSTTTLYDSRDGKAYTIAKLADGKYWMTTNLDIAGGTALSADDTDVTSAYISNYTSSTIESENGRLAKSGDKLVLPASATKNSEDNNLSDNTQFSQDNYSYVFNSGNTTNCGADEQYVPCYSYYSWDTATLGSGRTIATNNTDAEQSICPKGWRLPTSRHTSTFDSTVAAQSDFYGLATSYGMSTGVWAQSTDDFYTKAGPGTTPDFLVAGYYYSGSFASGGSGGHYWSSTTVANVGFAYYLDFGSSNFKTDSVLNRFRGLSVRCLFDTD